MQTAGKAASVMARALVAPALVALLATPRAHAEGRRSRPSGADSSAPSAPAAAELPAPPGYDLAVELGFAAFERADYRAARAQFARAHELYPNARTLRALGKVEYELSQYLASIAYLEAALAASERPLTPAQRAETDELLARVRSHVATVLVSVAPASAALLLDGVAVELPVDGRWQLTVGDHLLEASAPGRLAQRHVLRVEPGRTLRVNVLLEAEPRADAEPERRRLYKNPWLWGGVLALVSAAAVGGALAARKAPAAHEPTGGSSGVTITLPDP